MFNFSVYSQLCIKNVEFEGYILQLLTCALNINLPIINKTL